MPAAVVGTTATADAFPGHTSCKDLGHHNAAEARSRLVEEVRSLSPDNVDDIVALAQLGGTDGAQDVPALCTAK